MKRKILWVICTLLSLILLISLIDNWLEGQATEKIIQENLNKRGWTDRHEDLNYNMKFGNWEMIVRYDAFPGEEYDYKLEDELTFIDKVQSLFGKQPDYDIFGSGHCDANVKCETKRHSHKYAKQLKEDAKYDIVHNRSTGLEPYMEGEWVK
ncbi:hypothetical protein [Macrococcus brunensis]|uniref:hypothetical protein n=1 Tax=Macrococcus brunensis TaxID=198483 RepID=UPI001EF1380A|nr:hypothetical protein [Macrococcus brunensis]ULG71977.1 hypothetical protein MGG12_00170 [Macrococcus brunensis]